MRKSRFTEEQIIKVLKEHAAGLSAGELCRKYGVSDATFYKWRSRYGGMEISDARRLKALEDENRKLKKLLAETMLDASTRKEMLGKEGMLLAFQRHRELRDRAIDAAAFDDCGLCDACCLAFRIFRRLEVRRGAVDPALQPSRQP